MNTLTQEEQLLQAIEQNPKNPEKYSKVAKFYHRKSKFEQAIPYYEQAISLEPVNAKNYYDMGCCYFQLKNYEEAKKSISKGLALKEDDEGYSTLARVYYNMGEYSEALLHCKKAIELTEKATATATAIGDGYAIVSSKHSLSEYYHQMGKCYYKLREYEDALDSFYKEKELIIKIDIDHFSTSRGLNMNSIASCYYKLGDKRKAVQYQLQSIKSVSSEYVPYMPLFGLSQVFSELNNPGVTNAAQHALLFTPEDEVGNLKNYIAHREKKFEKNRYDYDDRGI